MTATVGALNVLLGVVYTGYGVLTFLDLRRNWAARGPSHFGLAWLVMAFTCGPHHLEHGLHVLVTGRPGGVLDLVAVVVGLPAGLIWFLLRLEALHGGSGDREIRGTPAMVAALPTLGATYLVAIVTAGLLRLDGAEANWHPSIVANILLVVLYGAIGAVLFGAQMRRNRITGSWSVSGLSLTVVFPTCALMHGAWAVYASTGYYDADWHLLVIDVLAVPAAAYFLWVVWSLALGRIHDWNDGSTDLRLPADVDPVVVEPLMGARH